MPPGLTRSVAARGGGETNRARARSIAVLFYLNGKGVNQAEADAVAAAAEPPLGSVRNGVCTFGPGAAVAAQTSGTFSTGGIIHELLHPKVPHHGPVFRALLSTCLKGDDTRDSVSPRVMERR